MIANEFLCLLVKMQRAPSHCAPCPYVRLLVKISEHPQYEMLPHPSTESRLLCTLNWVFYSCFYFKHPTIQLSNFPQFSCATCRILRRNFLFFQIFQVFLNHLSVFFVFQRFFLNRFLDFVSILSVVVLLMMRNSENLQRKSYLQCHGNFIQLSSFRSYINAH